MSQHYQPPPLHEFAVCGICKAGVGVLWITFIYTEMDEGQWQSQDTWVQGYMYSKVSRLCCTACVFCYKLMTLVGDGDGILQALGEHCACTDVWLAAIRHHAAKKYYLSHNGRQQLRAGPSNKILCCVGWLLYVLHVFMQHVHSLFHLKSNAH